MTRTFAAINVDPYQMDLGIYEMSERIGMRSVDYVQHVMGSGIESYANGKISYHQVEEMCEVLTDFTRIMKGYQVAAYRAYAANSVRDALNSRIVLDQIRVRTGIDVRVISNAELRFINYKAIAVKDAEFQKSIQKGTAVVTVGFGSTHFSVFDKDSLISSQNLSLGVMQLYDMAVSANVTTEQEKDLICEMIDNELVSFRKIYLKDREIRTIIATGRPIMNIYFKLRGKEMKRGYLSAAEFKRFFEIIRQMSIEQLEDYFELNTQTATQLFPTAAVFERVMELTGAETMWIPGIRITDGIAAKHAEERKFIRFNHNFENDIIAISRNMAKRYKCYMPHIQAVEQLALKIFDALKKYHGLKAREQLLLLISADLHDCGNFITMYDASDCAYSIVMESEIVGLSHMEQEIVANVVRYHGQEFGYDDMGIEERTDWGGRLSTPDNLSMTVAKLTAMLRLAIALDSGQKNKLEDCRLSVKGDELVITTGCRSDVTLEKLSVEQCEDFFREIFGICPVLKQKKKV